MMENVGQGRAPVLPTALGGKFVSSAAAITALAATLALGIGVFTPPHGGVLCVSDCVPPPYTDVAGIIVAESIWIYPALVMVLGFVALTAGLHEVTPPHRRSAALAAMAFAVLSAGILISDYAVHLMAVMPSVARGEGSAVALFSMYNPHGLFIALENAGYFLIGLAFLGISGAIGAEGRVSRAVRWTFAGAGGLLVGALPLFGIVFGGDLDVRYEVFAISVAYLGLILGGTMLAAIGFSRGAVPIPTSTAG
jgi:hypothetical protein